MLSKRVDVFIQNRVFSVASKAYNKYFKFELGKKDCNPNVFDFIKSVGAETPLLKMFSLLFY